MFAATNDATLPLRVRQRQELNDQIVHDSIHRREGWTVSYLLEANGSTAGFGSVAKAGPWKNKPTIFEFYLLPEYRIHSFALFEALLATSNASFMEVQSNQTLLTVMLHTFARNVESEKIVFHDEVTTTLQAQGAVLKELTPKEEVEEAITYRQGGAEYQLLLNGQTVATGGVLFHYNAPYGDIYMETAESSRRRGFGSYLAQQLKRRTYEWGSIPCARCSPANLASR